MNYVIFIDTNVITQTVLELTVLLEISELIRRHTKVKPVPQVYILLGYMVKNHL